MQTLIKVTLGIALVMIAGAAFTLAFLIHIFFLAAVPFSLFPGLAFFASGSQELNRGKPRYQYEMEPGKTYNVIYHQRDGGYALLADEEWNISFWQLKESPPGGTFAADYSTERKLIPMDQPWRDLSMEEK